MRRKHILVFVLICLSLWCLVYLFNETVFFYYEPKTYQISKKTQYFSPEVAPCFNTNPHKNGVILFIHGFKDTPNSFRRIAHYFSGKYNVIIPLLPGHGTSEQDFKRTYFSQWYAYIRDIYIDCRKNYKYVYLCGSSMGGLIALRLSEEFTDRSAPDGVIAIATPVFLNNLCEKGILYDWRLYFSRFVSWFLSELKDSKKETDEDGAHWVGYKGKYFLKQVHSLKIAMYYTKKDLSKIKVPMLLIHDMGDRTVPFENMQYITEHVSTKNIQTKAFNLKKWKHTRHLLTLYRSTQYQVIMEIKTFLNQLELSRTLPSTSCN